MQHLRAHVWRRKLGPAVSASFFFASVIHNCLQGLFPTDPLAELRACEAVFIGAVPVGTEKALFARDALLLT